MNRTWPLQAMAEIERNKFSLDHQNYEDLKAKNEGRRTAIMGWCSLEKARQRDRPTGNCLMGRNRWQAFLRDMLTDMTGYSISWCFQRKFLVDSWKNVSSSPGAEPREDRNLQNWYLQCLLGPVPEWSGWGRWSELSPCEIPGYVIILVWPK